MCAPRIPTSSWPRQPVSQSADQSASQPRCAHLVSEPVDALEGHDIVVGVHKSGAGDRDGGLHPSVAGFERGAETLGEGIVAVTRVLVVIGILAVGSRRAACGGGKAGLSGGSTGLSGRVSEWRGGIVGTREAAAGETRGPGQERPEGWALACA